MYLPAELLKYSQTHKPFERSPNMNLAETGEADEGNILKVLSREVSVVHLFCVMLILEIFFLRNNKSIDLTRSTLIQLAFVLIAPNLPAT
jgi:hypothetical protein